MFEVRAPGRVNLIGEHTDYNGGFVLPAAIDLEMTIEADPTMDRRVDLELAATGERAGFDLDRIGPRTGGWIDYVAGVARALISGEYDVGGFRGVLRSSIPVGAGLSSSAALDLCAAWAMLASADPDRSSGSAQFDPLALAQACQRGDNEYVGIGSGLMDQFASSCGVAGHALLLDCRSLEYRPVVIPTHLALVVVDTSVRRRLIASEYNARRVACERGVAILAARDEPVTSLRDVTDEMLDRAADELGSEILRRCRHVVDENRRTLEAVAALEADDRDALGRLFAASHASLRDLYDVSSPELDAAVEIARRTPGVVAARLTGAGFGGCTVNLVDRDAVQRLKDAIAAEYPPLTGLEARVLEVQAASGAGYVSSTPTTLAT